MRIITFAIVLFFLTLTNAVNASEQYFCDINEVQTKEFLIYEKYLTNNSIVFFHDVIACNLFKSYFYLKKKYKNYSFKFLNKSSNGIAVCLKKKPYKKIYIVLG